VKVSDVLSPIKRLRADQHAVAVQATFDPRRSNVVRLHLVPLKHGTLSRKPSMVFINGWYLVLMGPAWSDLLRAFIQALEEKAQPGKVLSYEEMEKVLEQVFIRMHELYPNIPRIDFNRDLEQVLEACQAVAHGEPAKMDVSTDWTYEQLGRQLRAPHRMDLLVSPMIEAGEWICPLHCKGCYAAQQPAMTIDKSLTTKQWKAIIDRCREAGIPQLTFTGGEPTQREDLVELIDHARWHITRLNTNGLNLTLTYARELFNASLDGIQITLYSNEQSIHDELVGKRGAWKKTVQGIINTLKAGLSVSVNTPLVKRNAKYPATLQFIYNLGVKYVTCSGLIPAGAATAQIKAGEALSNAELMRVLRSSVKLARKLNLDLSFTSPGWLSAQQLHSLGLQEPICGACLTNMAVMPNGAVTACQSTLDDPEGFGFLLTTPWKKIWNHPCCKRMRRTTQEGCPLKESMS